MCDQFQEWLSGKDFKIFDKFGDKIGDTSQKKSLIEFENDLNQIQEISVYLSEDSVVESLAITNTTNKNVLKWFNDVRLRKQVLEEINCSLTNSKKVFECLETISSNTAIRISRTRVQNLLKTLNYSIDNEIFSYSNEYYLSSVGYSLIRFLNESESFVLKLINEVIGCLISGIPMIVLTIGESALVVSYFLELCEKAGLPSGVFNFVILDNETALKLNSKLSETQSSSFPIFVVLESADIESAADRIISSSVNDTNRSLNVFVQQSVYSKLCERMRNHLTNRLEIGDKFDTNVDIMSKINVNYEAIDFDNENKSFDIQVFKFRTNAELKTFINHFTRIPFISLWAEKTSLALELAKAIDSSSKFFINSSVKYPVKYDQIPILIKALDITDFTASYVQSGQTCESTIDSYKKWKTIPAKERLKYIRNFLIENKTKIAINPSILETFNQKISENTDSFGIEIVITDFESVGLLVLNIDKELSSSTFQLILEALISGNLLLIKCSKPIEDLVKLSQYLSSLGHLCVVFANNDQQIKGNKILMSGGERIGIQFENLKITRNSLIELKKSITQSMGDISFAT